MYKGNASFNIAIILIISILWGNSCKKRLPEAKQESALNRVEMQDSVREFEIWGHDTNSHSEIWHLYFSRFFEAWELLYLKKRMQYLTESHPAFANVQQEFSQKLSDELGHVVSHETAAKIYDELMLMYREGKITWTSKVGHIDTGYICHPEICSCDSYDDNGSYQKVCLNSGTMRGIFEGIDLTLDYLNTSSAVGNTADQEAYQSFRQRFRESVGLPLNDHFPYDDLRDVGLSQSKNRGHGTRTLSLMNSPPGMQRGTLPERYIDGNIASESHGVWGAAPFLPYYGTRFYDSVIVGRVPWSNGSVVVLPSADSVTQLIRALNKAYDEGARVFSLSIGGESFNELEEAIEELAAKGALIVAAAGNATGRIVTEPAEYDTTIAAAGCYFEGAWKHTARSSEVDICAPGNWVRHASPIDKNHENEERFDTWVGEGTSLSTAVAASAVALWVEYHGFPYLFDRYGGQLYKALRCVLKQSAYRPQIDSNGIPQDNILVYKSPEMAFNLRSRFNAFDRMSINFRIWENGYGAGLLNARKLLTQPLPSITDLDQDVCKKPM